MINIDRPFSQMTRTKTNFSKLRILQNLIKTSLQKHPVESKC